MTNDRLLIVNEFESGLTFCLVNEHWDKYDRLVVNTGDIPDLEEEFINDFYDHEGIVKLTKEDYTSLDLSQIKRIIIVSQIP